MSIDSRHPDFIDVEDDYRLMRDSFGGQRVIKDAGIAYLPPTAGMVLDGFGYAGQKGTAAYNAYRTRAIYPEMVKEAVSTLVGVMHRKPPVIKAPARMQPLIDNTTRKGETAPALLRRINEQQLLFGRFGMLLDVAEAAITPHIVTYKAETIINWDDERLTEFERDMLSFLVLNETVAVRGAGGADLFDWRDERRFRVAFLGFEDEELEQGDIVYKTFTEVDDARSLTVIPDFNGRRLSEVPWVFVGANDLCSDPDEIPLLGLANMALAIYRGEADYRQSLHMQGQDVFVIISDDDGQEQPEGVQVRLGAGSVVRVPLEGDAKYEGVNSDGLGEQRSALSNDYTRGREMGSRLLEQRGSQAESGEALRVRLAASTATLREIALTGAAGLQTILRQAAMWMGEDPEAVTVAPNLDFAEIREAPSGPKELMEARKQGFPLSLKTLHRWAQENEFTRLTFDEEIEQIRLEQELVNELSEMQPDAAQEAAPATEPQDDTPPDDDEDDEGE